MMSQASETAALRPITDDDFVREDVRAWSSVPRTRSIYAITVYGFPIATATRPALAEAGR